MRCRSASASSSSPCARRPSTMIQFVLTHVGPFQYPAASNCARVEGHARHRERRPVLRGLPQPFDRAARPAPVGNVPDQSGRNVAIVGTRMSSPGHRVARVVLPGGVVPQRFERALGAAEPLDQRDRQRLVELVGDVLERAVGRDQHRVEGEVLDEHRPRGRQSSQVEVVLLGERDQREHPEAVVVGRPLHRREVARVVAEAAEDPRQVQGRRDAQPPRHRHPLELRASTAVSCRGRTPTGG